MRYRQIHLDYHNGREIPGLARLFEPEKFADRLVQARVNSINLFSKCVHGWSYHPTEVGKMHPGLDFNLLRAQLDAVHARGIAAPLYLCAGWDEKSAFDQPGWRLVTPDGALLRNLDDGPLGTGWAYMDFASPYLDYFVAQVAETARMFPDGDGFWIDICSQLPSASVWAQARMDAQGLDWTDTNHLTDFAEQVQFELFDRVSDAIKRENPRSEVFFNFGHIRRGRRDALKYYSYFDIESLPTTYWGYDHFPLTARYIEQFGKPMIGMSGKFHHTWGEVGTYKLPDAIKMECASMVAHGALCSFGDHLHPTAELDASTYAGIGVAYQYIEKLEPWLEGSANRAQIGLISLQASKKPRYAGKTSKHDDTDEGAVRALLDAKFTFDVLDEESDFLRYALIIIPDAVEVSDSLKGKMEVYLTGGGKLLLTGTSGVREGEFLFDVGARYVAPTAFAYGDYCKPVGQIAPSFTNEPIFMYSGSNKFALVDGVALGEIYEPYYDRSPKHFSGHVQTPRKPDPAGRPAGVNKGPVTYFGYPLFSAYKHSGALTLLEMIEKLLGLILGDRLVETDLPRAGRLTIRTQKSENRDIVHILHANPALRGDLVGDTIQVIQDLVTLKSVSVAVLPRGPIARVEMVPQGIELAYVQCGESVRFSVPDVRGTQVVSIQYV